MHTDQSLRVRHRWIIEIQNIPQQVLGDMVMFIKDVMKISLGQLSVDI